MPLVRPVPHFRSLAMKRHWIQAVAAWLVVLAFVESSRSQQPLPSSKATRTVYILDARLANDIATAANDEQRKALLEKRWDATKMAVLHCNAVLRTPFFTTGQYWSSGGTFPPDTQRIEGNLTQPKIEAEPAEAAPKKADGDAEKKADAEPAPGAPRVRFAASNKPPRLIVIRGDCLAEMTLTERCTVHIYGDLGAKLSVKGQSEVVIAGSVREKSLIETDGIARLFVGGDVRGDIRNKGSATLWIHGDLHGHVTTGSPSTDITLIGDFWGDIRPNGERGSLISLDFRGFAPSKSIEAIVDERYTKFDASIAESDCEPGIYPPSGRPVFVPGGPPPRLINGNWVIHRRTDPELKKRSA